MLTSQGLHHIQATGEFAFRVGRSYTRLEDPIYRAESIFRADQQGWPGDWEGRTLLSLCLLERLTGRRAAFLQENLEALDTQWNSRGYLKEICPPGIVDEQQLSGHNWLLRALLELYIASHDGKYQLLAQRIVDHLYLPLIGHYASYPTAPGERSCDGGAAGHIAGIHTSGWKLSTDIGCAFISFDGLAQHYQLFRGDQLRLLLEEMYSRFSQIDFVACSVQTHATLSALRGILRFYETTGQLHLLDFAEQLFSLYLENGLTENYANYNWFGRPRWTEPCAVVDAYMASMDLFCHTGKDCYAQTANRILYNALLAAQRSNGGFGCDLCAGTAESDVWLTAKQSAYEAFWCCTMRGAEGLCCAAANNVLTDEEHIYITHYISGTYHTSQGTILIESRYPHQYRAKITLCGLKRPVVLHLYIPKEANSIQLEQDGAVRYSRCGAFITAEATRDSVFILYFSIQNQMRPLIGSLSAVQGMVEWNGDLILGKTDDQSPFLLCDRFYSSPQTGGKVRIIHPIGE